MNVMVAFFLNFGVVLGTVLSQYIVWPRRFRKPLTLLALATITLAVTAADSVPGVIACFAQVPVVALALTSWQRYRRIVVLGSGRRFRFARGSALLRPPNA